MQGDLLYASILNIVTGAIPSAFILINGKNKIVDFRISRRSPVKSQLIVGKPFFRLFDLCFRKQNSTTIYEAIVQCRATGELLVIQQIPFTTPKGALHYFKWDLAPIPGTDFIVAFVQDVTESVLIEEEFKDLCDQQESINQDLCIAMSKLDFQYMDLDQAHRKLNTLYRITSVVQRTVYLPEIFA